MVELLLLMFEFEVLVYYWALLLLYQENMEQVGYGLRMRNPVCLYLNLDMRYLQVRFGMNVELDDELFLVDEGEGLWLSILKYFYFNSVDFQFFVSNIILLYYIFLKFLHSDYYLLLFIFNFLSAGF